jgi:hypothetical protein
MNIKSLVCSTEDIINKFDKPKSPWICSQDHVGCLIYKPTGELFKLVDASHESHLRFVRLDLFDKFMCEEINDL